LPVFEFYINEIIEDEFFYVRPLSLSRTLRGSSTAFYTVVDLLCSLLRFHSHILNRPQLVYPPTFWLIDFIIIFFNEDIDTEPGRRYRFGEYAEANGGTW